jgi:hypothetical protein
MMDRFDSGNSRAAMRERERQYKEDCARRGITVTQCIAGHLRQTERIGGCVCSDCRRIAREGDDEDEST